MKDLQSALNPKPKKTQTKEPPGTSTSSLELRVAPPVIKVAPPNVTVEAKGLTISDSGALGASIAEIGQQMRFLAEAMASQIADNNKQLLAVMKKQNEILAKLVEISSVKLPAKKPGDFYVELDKDMDGSTVGMRISPRRH